MKYLKFTMCIFVLCIALSACKENCAHAYESKTTQAPSCTQTGVETFTCTLCQDSYTTQIPVLEHSFDEGMIEQEATCLNEGTKKYTCTGCGLEKTEPLAKLAHTLGEPSITKEPNCTEEGEYSATCVDCGASEVVEKIPTNSSHIFTNEVIREATCTDPGEGVNVCTLCQHREACYYELKQHAYNNGEILTAPTCTKNGTKQYTCTNCKATYKETIAEKGHQWKNATCTTKGVCSVCGIESNTVGHDYVTISEDRPQNTYTFYASKRVKQCNTCGLRKTEYFTELHEYDLEAIREELANYARELGFNVSYELEGDISWSYAMEAYMLEVPGWGPAKLIKGGKARLDAAYAHYAPTPAGISRYTVHLFVTYGESGATGSGAFGVSFSVTS